MAIGKQQKATAKWQTNEIHSLYYSRFMLLKKKNIVGKKSGVLNYRTAGVWRWLGQWAATRRRLAPVRWWIVLQGRFPAGEETRHRRNGVGRRGAVSGEVCTKYMYVLLINSRSVKRKYVCISVRNSVTYFTQVFFSLRFRSGSVWSGLCVGGTGTSGTVRVRCSTRTGPYSGGSSTETRRMGLARSRR